MRKIRKIILSFLIICLCLLTSCSNDIEIKLISDNSAEYSELESL